MNGKFSNDVANCKALTLSDYEKANNPRSLELFYLEGVFYRFLQGTWLDKPDFFVFCKFF